MFYVLLTIFLFSLLWEFALEGFLFLDSHEGIVAKIEDVLTTTVIALLALIFPVYKGVGTHPQLAGTGKKTGVAIGPKDHQS